MALVIDPKETIMFETIRKSLFELGFKYIDIEYEDFKSKNFKLNDGVLYYGDKEISVMYFRHFYDHSHFNDEAIEVEAMAHASRTIMIPDPLTVLMSLKFIQHFFYSEKIAKQFNLEHLKNEVPQYFSH